METQNITLRNVLKSYRTIIERGKIDIHNTQIYDLSLSWLDAGTSIKSCGVKLVLWAQTSPLTEMMR